MTDILDGFDEIDSAIRDDMAQRRRGSGLIAADRNPDEYARANSLADRRGLPVDVVADNLPDFEARERADDFDALGRDHPETHGFLADPRRMALAQDDARGMRRVAETLKAGRKLPVLPDPIAMSGNGDIPANPRDRETGRIYVDKRGMPRRWLGDGWGSPEQSRETTRGEFAAGAGVDFVQGLTRVPESMLDLIGWAAGGQSLLTPEGRRGFQDARDTLEALKPQAYRAEQAAPILQRGEDGSVEGFNLPTGESLFGTVSQSLPQTPTMIYGGGGLRAAIQKALPNAPRLTAFLGYGTANAALVAPGGAEDARLQSLDAGANQEQAQKAANKAMLLGVPLTFATGGAGGALAASQGATSGNLASAIVRGFAADAPTEGIEEAGQSIIGDVATGRPVDAANAVEAGLLASIAGGAPGAAIAGTEYTATRALRRLDSDNLQQLRQSVEDAANLQALTAAGAELKLGERSPADAEDYARAIAGDQRVYLPAAEARRLFQSEPQILSDLVGGDDVLVEQLAAGDISIPVGKWVAQIARMPNADEITRFARMDPDGISAAELERMDAESAELFGDTGDAATRAEPAAPDPRQQIIDDVTGQLLALERYTPAQVEAQAMLWGAAFSTMGRRAGADPFALYQRYMLSVRNGGADPLTSRPFAGSARTDALIDSIRRGSDADNPLAFGQSLTRWLTAQGGVQDQTGELRGMDARKIRPGLVNGAGLQLDRARELAAKAGFLDADSTVADFLDLIDRDLRKNDVTSEKLGNDERKAFMLERQQLVDAIADNPRLRDMPRTEFEALTNQQIADELFGRPTALNQGPAGGSVSTDERTRSDQPERNAYETLGAIGGRAPATGWASSTRIRGVDGNPGTVYRGSSDGQTRPDDFGRVGAATGHPSAGLGVWFSSSNTDAASYGKASPYHLDLRNPKAYTVDDAPEFDTIGEAVALRKQLQAAGHDGIVFDFRDVGGPRQFVVFAPEQVVLPAQTLKQDAAPAPADPVMPTGLIDRAIGSIKTLFQGKAKDQTKTPEFKRWFGGSKVVDANGDPLVVYHGTRGDFETFEKTGETDYGFLGKGFYFTRNAEDASEYAMQGPYFAGVDVVDGANVIPAFLSIKNPKVLSEYPPIWSREQAEDYARELQSQGHDGVVFTPNANHSRAEWVAFRPEQIKSATANRGTFDPADPSILKQQQTDAGTRGQINIFPDRRMSIELFERADRTTFLHESGHFFFEVMRDLASMPDAAPDIAADWDALLLWLGAENADALTVDQLEQFARGFESYLGEGKAPSPELRSVFAKFSAWILGVYRTLRGLNVELTDDVRAVFDRMLASDEEIEAAHLRQGMVPLDFKVGGEIGITEKQLQAYAAMIEDAAEEGRADLRQKTLSALERERKAWWKEERAKVRQDVAERYEATPAVRALRVLSGRRSIDGVALEPPLAGLKLDREAVVNSKYLKRLGRTYAKSGGVHPDEAAALLGYASGDDLLRAIANAPDTIARVEAETDTIMRERHGDPMVDGTLAEKAMDAVHNSKRIRVLEHEIELLSKMTGQPAPPRRVLKAIAEKRVLSKTARSLRPNEFLAAERRAAREAVTAAAKGDLAAALLAKRQQAVNVAMFASARDALARYERQVRYLQRMETSGRRAALGKAGADYLEQVDALLEAVELRPVSGRQVERRQKLAEWVKKQEADGRSINIPPKLLYEAGLTNIRDLTLEEVAGLVDTIKQIAHLAKTKNTPFDGRQERDRAEVDAEMAASVIAAHGQRPERTGDELLPEKISRLVTDLDLARLQPTNLARELDGYQPDGAVWRNVILPVREAIFRRVMPAMRAMQDDVAAIYTAHYSKEELRRIDSPVWREDVRDHWSKGRILSLAMHWGSDGNRDAILTQAHSRLTEMQAINLLRTLDTRDWAFVQAMVDKVNSYWPEIAETQRRRTGLTPEKVDGKPFLIETADGKMLQVRGGYFPLKYDAERSGYGVSREEADEIYNDLRVGRTAKAATKHGHTIARVGSGGRTVSMNLDLATSHMRSVIRDLELGDAIAYVHNTVNGHDFTTAVIGAGKRAHLKALELWLKDMAIGEAGPRHALEKAAHFVRLNTTAAVLTYKASTALLQLTGFVQSAAVIGPRPMVAGIRRLMSKSWVGPNSVWSDIRERSPFMAERFGSVADQVDEVMNARAGRINSSRAAMIRWGYVPMARMQMIVDAATWLAGESVGLKKFDGDADKARAFADDLVIRAQSSSEFMDKSQLQRGTLSENMRQSEFIRTATMLQSYMMTKGNIVREKYQATKFVSPTQTFKFGLDMIQLFAIEAMAVALLRNGLPDPGDDEDDDGMVDEWAWYVSKEMGLGAIGTFPGTSPLASEWRGFTAQGVTDRGWGAVADATGAWMDDELDRKDAKQAVNVAGVIAGVPSSQINTTASALWRVHDGEDVSPLDFLIKPEKPRD